MKAIKGVLIYIGIVIGVAVGMALILLCVMYFFPTVRIAGVGVVHYQKNTEESTISLDDYTGYDDVILSVTSDKIGVNIIPIDDDEIKYSMHLSIFGVSTEIVEYKLGKQIVVRDGKLQIFLNVTEPNGWISTSDSCVNVKVPSNFEMDLVTNTGKGNIVVGSNKKSIKLSSLAVTTDNGNLSLINVGAGDKEKSLVLSSLNLTTNNGKFDLSLIDNLTVANKVKLYSQNGTFKFKNLFASMEITGNSARVEAERITSASSGFTAIAQNFYLNTKKIECPIGAENTMIADNMQLNISEVYGKAGIVTVYGDVNIGTLNDYAMIENKNGNIKINKAKETIIATSYMGNILVDSYAKTGKFTNKKGDIDVKSTSDFLEGCYTEIYNVDGDVKVHNKINKLLLKTEGRSDVEVIFDRVKSGFESVSKVFQHKIHSSTSGTCVVFMPSESPTIPYMFVAKGIISGEISGLTTEDGGMRVHSSESEQYFPSVNMKNQTTLNASFEFIGRVELRSYSNV